MDVRPHDRRGSAGSGEARVLTPDERDVPTGAAALAKGLYLLDVIGEAPTPPRFKDLQAATGLPKGTLARMLNTLVLFRLIRQEDSDATYRLGHRLFELAHRVWESFDLRGAAAPVLERLAEETRETAALCAIDNDEALYIDQRSRGGPYGFRIEIGRRAPLHCTAGGKALLAFAQPHEQRAVFDRIKLERFTEATFTQEDALLADLALARARGYAISLEEHVAGVASVAAPIFDHTGSAVAAIGIFGPSSRLTSDRLHVTGRDLMAAARQISGNVGATPLNMNISPSIQSGRAVDPEVECVLPWGAHLAEGPVWSAPEKRLYWVDILAPSINRFDPATRANEEVMLPRLVSAVARRRGGGLVALTQDGLEAFDFASGTLTPLVDPEAEISDNRFNDGKCDRQGRLWAGTMRLDASRTSGSLYAIAPDLSWERRESGLTVANGLDWSPDGRTFYFADSAPGRIYAYDFDIREGTLGRRRIFAEIDRALGRPDGLAVDSEGFVWCAVWDGWCLHRYAPDGKLVREVRLPVPRPTSIAFGGDGLKTLFITSARVRLPSRVLTEAPLSGGLFTLPVDVPGLHASEFGA
ncbi:SMP-30/gluconolactonase/LRE family protein [Bosea lathyri]|uniref:Transcriptional regulator, IclR family n=1 Tax=Bosea lathyri TaxID=1036778 RepID=A0A1H5VGF9_9HYPH|nr:SMP-30/gluconolactonase/LRE family protein [Bosea lathyri]SEF86422.1 transcriptional regulator, IclR family [Bosea lathyri]